MKTLLLLLLGACAACDRAAEDEDPTVAGVAGLPPSDEEFRSIASPDLEQALAAAVEEGLSTRTKGADLTRFIVIRDGGRHGAAYRAREFTAVIGAGVTLPEGSLRIRREWIASGMIDGTNEQLQTMALSVAVEPDAPRPFAPGVVAAVSAFCKAVTARVALHPDCVVAMSEVPYARQHEAGRDEAALAAAARAELPVPAPGGRVKILTADGRPIQVPVEVRDTSAGRQIGMMMRRRFAAENSGMLFVYPHATYRRFHMRNCFIPIDVAYFDGGRIDEIVTMKPEAGSPPASIPWYPSRSAVRYALEMPAGWFARNEVDVGDGIEIE